VANWMDFSMTIQGLDAGTYEIRCGGAVIGTKTHTELAAGWNMFDLTVGPVWEQVQGALVAYRNLQGMDPVTGADLAHPADDNTVRQVNSSSLSYQNDNTMRGATYQAHQDPYIADLAGLNATLKTQCDPIPRTYTITQTISGPVGQGTLPYKSRASVGRRR